MTQNPYRRIRENLLSYFCTGSKAIWDYLLRAKTPPDKLRKQLTSKFTPGVPDWAIPGMTVDKVHVDHIIPAKTIASMDGFDRLPLKNQIKVLNYEPNFMLMSEAANTSRGDKSFEEWTDYKGIKVNEDFRQQMIKREQELRPAIQNRINQLLQNPDAARRSRPWWRLWDAVIEDFEEILARRPVRLFETDQLRMAA